MNFSVGVFDLAAYAMPGSLYLTLCLYIGDRLNWLSVASIAKLPTVVLVVAAAVASYILGHLSYPISGLLDRYPRDRIATAQASVRATFLGTRVDDDRSRRLVCANIQLLHSAAEIHHRDTIAESNRLRALGLMVRGCASAMLLATPVAALELALGSHKAAAATLLILFVVLAVAGVRRSRQLRDWAAMKTLEVTYWMPEIDSVLLARDVPPAPPTRQA
jgi:hypothetical protein